MIELKNEKLTVLIKEFGAEIASVKNAAGREYFWCGDKKFWGGQAPVLFPVCGKLLNLAFRHKGKTYTMKGHGFARNKTFRAEKIGDTCAVFTLCDDEETRAQYPFAFRLSVRYELNGESIVITNSVENTGDETMYFNFGSHEAYAADGNFEDWSVEFEKTENLRILEQIGPAYLTGRVLPFRDGVKELKLSYAMFEEASLAFDKIQSRAATLKCCGKPVVHVDFTGFDQLLLWTKPNAPFICIEPWNGVPDYIDTDGDLSHKRGILALEAGKTYSMPHTLQFFD
mgnify:CR=1 FL=1